MGFPYIFIDFPWISDSVLLYPESVFLWTVSLDGTACLYKQIPGTLKNYIEMIVYLHSDAIQVLFNLLRTRLFTLFGQGAVLRGTTPPSPTQEGPFPQSSWAPEGESRGKLTKNLLSEYPPATLPNPPHVLDPVDFL